MTANHSQPVPPNQAISRRILYQIGEIFGRSLFPILALVVILGTPLWGAWVSLLLSFVCWCAVMRFA